MIILFKFKDLLIIFTCWIFFIKDIAGLKLNRLIIDGPIEGGSSIWLFCDFKLDIGEQRAFTSKFYKNNIEFYRYSISNDLRRPSKKYFNQPAVNVNIQKSNGSHVFLENVVPMSEGTFSCEINTDEPFFMSMQAQQDLRVYVLPKKRLQLVNVKDNYRDGELINIQCRSSPSKPPVFLRWHINNQQITKNEENLNITYQIFDHDPIDSGLSYSISNLTFYLCTNTSKITNNLKARKCSRSNRISQLLKQSNAIYIRCSGVLSQIKDESSEELIVEEKGQNSRFEQSTNSDQVKPPKIENNQNLNYQIGELLQLNCSSPIGLPAAYLEWFVNNKRINEQYVYNYVENNFEQQTEINELNNNFDNLKKSETIKNNRLLSNDPHLIINSNDQTMPESNSHHFTKSSKTSKLTKSSHLNRLNYKKQTRKNDHRSEMKDFQNDYLFSNNLKKLNLLSFHQRNKNNLTTSQNLIGQALQFDNLTFLNHPNLSFINQQALYNHNVNLTRLQNIIYQHYSDYSFKPSSHKIGIKFRLMKKHYQTLDLLLRVKCVATYGKIIIQDQTTIALFADGHSYHTSQYFNALEISAASTSYSTLTYSSFIPVILISFVHLIKKISLVHLIVFFKKK